MTMALGATPSSVSNACAAGIWLDFSAMSTCASTRAVSVALAAFRGCRAVWRRDPACATDREPA
ncbi:MAG: hypothetical protein M0Z28_27620 [Rhodospirillales bacterium]|nr:hypothetical protein [Rhodospirillales bacterium]